MVGILGLGDEIPPPCSLKHFLEDLVCEVGEEGSLDELIPEVVVSDTKSFIFA